MFLNISKLIVSESLPLPKDSTASRLQLLVCATNTKITDNTIDRRTIHKNSSEAVSSSDLAVTSCPDCVCCGHLTGTSNLHRVIKSHTISSVQSSVSFFSSHISCLLHVCIKSLRCRKYMLFGFLQSMYLWSASQNLQFSQVIPSPQIMIYHSWLKSYDCTQVHI